MDGGSGQQATNVTPGCFGGVSRIRKSFIDIAARQKHNRSQMTRFLGLRSSSLSSSRQVPRSTVKSDPSGYTITNLEHDATLRDANIAELPKHAAMSETIASEFSFPTLTPAARQRLTSPALDDSKTILIFDGPTSVSAKALLEKETQTEILTNSQANDTGDLLAAGSAATSVNLRMLQQLAAQTGDSENSYHVTDSGENSAPPVMATSPDDPTKYARDSDKQGPREQEHGPEESMSQTTATIADIDQPGKFGVHVEEEAEDELLDWSWHATFTRDEDDASSLASSWSNDSSLVSKSEFNQLKEALDQSANIALQNSVEAASLLTEANDRIKALESEVERLRREVKSSDATVSRIPRVPQGFLMPQATKSQSGGNSSSIAKLHPLRASTGTLPGSPAKLMEQGLMDQAELSLPLMEPFSVKVA